MDETKVTAGQDRPEAAAEAAPGSDARDRAHLYLDLWERQLVQAALHGRPVAMRPPRK